VRVSVVRLAVTSRSTATASFVGEHAELLERAVVVLERPGRAQFLCLTNESSIARVSACWKSVSVLRNAHLAVVCGLVLVDVGAGDQPSLWQRS
jgi:hypothetical protein